MTGLLHSLISCHPQSAAAVIVTSLLLFCFNSRDYYCLLICLFIYLNRNPLSHRVPLSLEAVIVLFAVKIRFIRIPIFCPHQFLGLFPWNYASTLPEMLRKFTKICFRNPVTSSRLLWKVLVFCSCFSFLFLKWQCPFGPYLASPLSLLVPHNCFLSITLFLFLSNAWLEISLLRERSVYQHFA